MSLRDEIEAAPRYGRSHYAAPMAKDENGPYMLRTDVLRIIDKHAAPVVDMTPGMQPRQPSKDVGELPAWVQYLRRLDREGVAMGGMTAHDRFIYPELADLDNLRRVILSGKGEGVIPEGVAKFLTCISDSTAPPSPAGTYRADGDSWHFTGHFEYAPGGVTESAERILSAIDSYANGLLS